MKKLVLYKAEVSAYETKEIKGKSFLVLPVSMMTPGERYGSGGPRIYTEDALRKSEDLWEAIPTTEGHPKDDKGEPISVYYSPEVMHSYMVGSVHNVRYERGALRGVVYLRDNDRFPKDKPVEVSIGAYEETEPGTNKVVALYPDHLALLYEEQGACSWKDGCGIRVNECGCGEKSEDLEENSKKDLQDVEDIVHNDESVGMIVEKGEDGMDKKEVEKTAVEEAAKVPEQKETVECPDCKEKELTDNTAGEVREITLQDFLQRTSAETRDFVMYSLNMAKAVKCEAVKKIMACENNPFTEKELQAKSVEELQKLSTFAAKKEDKKVADASNFLLNGLGNFQANEAITETGLEDVWANYDGGK